MTPAQIEKALVKYAVLLKDLEYEPIRSSPDGMPNDEGAFNHAYWMSLEAQKFVREKPAKAMRWLCFVQGILWTLGEATISALKDDNRSEDSTED